MVTTLAWILFLIVAFANGAIREIVLQKYLGMDVHVAHQFSCLTGVLLLTGFNILIWKKLNIRTGMQAASSGMAWLIATALFETLVLNRKLSTTEILQTYNLAKGEFWGLVLIWIGVMPVVIFAVKQNATRCKE